MPSDIEAAMKADSMLDKGDLDGAAVWRQIVAAVNEMQRAEPNPGERRHCRQGHQKSNLTRPLPVLNAMQIYR